MRIALLTDGIYPYVIGGMQKHSFYLTKYLVMNGIGVDLYHTAADRSAAQLDCFTESEKALIHGLLIPFPSLDRLPGHYIRESYVYSSRIAEALRSREAVDFIYIQGLCGMKLLEDRSPGDIPAGVNFHGLEMFQRAGSWRAKLEQALFRKPVRASLRKADYAFSLGGRLSVLLENEGVPQRKIVQIPIGIDSSWITGSIRATPALRRFVFVGRYERRKGIQELNHVLKELSQRREFDFCFVGDIPEALQLKEKNIRYTGKISDPQRIKNILQEADVLVCPSYSEGMPTVILEAMASGLAVIASDVGAVAEQVSEENGVLIRPGNTAELNAAMEFMLDLPAGRLEQMKQCSVQKVERSFLWEKVISSTVSFLEDVTRRG